MVHGHCPTHFDSGIVQDGKNPEDSMVMNLRKFTVD